MEVLAGVVGVLIERLHNESLSGESEKLERIILITKAELLEGDKWQDLSEQKKKLLNRLDHAVHEAEDLLDDCLPLVLRRAVHTPRNTIATKVNAIVSWRQRGYVMKKMRKAFEDISEIRRQCSLETALEETTPFVRDEEDVIGREFEEREVVKLVLEAANAKTKQKLALVTIVGAQGMGKTTLAQLVYNHAEVAQHFDLRMWVCVSDLVDGRLFVQKLIESAKGEKLKGDALQMDQLQKELRKKIKGKRFFLVLDGGRRGSSVNWMSLRDWLKGGAKGSTVLITTRSEKVVKFGRTVAQSYHLGPLSNENSWLLLKRTAFGANDQEQEVQEIEESGRKIAQKCEGVPIVIRHVGSSMARKSLDEWQSLLDDEIFDKIMREIGKVATQSFVREEEIVGREADKEAIMKRLLEHNSEEEALFISICGIAGLGKTALAQLVFNDSQVQDNFDLSIWVSVGDVFDFRDILEQFFASVTTTDLGDLPLDVLQLAINSAIYGKRCLLILDNMSSRDFEVKLDFLRRFLSHCAEGSRVIVTTRSEEVAFRMAGEEHTYQLKPLDEVSGWSLFVKVAFEKGEEPTNSMITDIGKKIVAKCEGIPLAIRTIGGILLFKKAETEWQSFYEKELPKIINEEVMLKLSYDQLPSFLKPCFKYCAIFPRDYEIDVQTLINLWISQGFVKQDSDLDIEAVGYQYFVELLQRSFFQETMRDELGRITKCKMQNFMCALARSMAQNVCATLGMKGGIDGTNPRHVSFHFHVDSSWHIRLLAQAKRIRSSMLHGQSRLEIEGRSSESVCDEIAKFKCLRLLDLHNAGIKIVSDSIGNLIHLRYLDLSQNVSIKTLPNSIGRLWHLQTLKLNHCGNLRKLPRAIKKLVNLRNLENKSCYSLTCMPRGLAQLTSLWTLSEFVLSNGIGSVSNKSGKLDELEELNELRGKLKIKNLRCFRSDETTRARLKEKEHLVSLVLIWDAEASIDTDDCEKSLEDLQPHPALRELSLSAYGGVGFSSWLSKHENLVKFSLSRCTKCKCLPPLHHLPRLEVLLVDDLPELEYISDGTSKDKLEAFFPYLKELQLTNMPKLARWWKHAASIEETKFPCLSKLIIEDCPNLISMPLFPTLEGLLVLNNTKWEPFQETIAAPQIPSTKSEASSSTSSTDVALSKLKTLHIINMPNGGPNTWQSFSSLRSLTLDHVQDIDTFLQGLHEQVTNPQEEKATNLQELHIWRCARLEDISLIKDIKSLRILSLKLCPNLKVPREKISFIISLQKVEIEECPHLSHIQRMLEDRSYEI